MSLILAVALVGCGSDDDTVSDATTASTAAPGTAAGTDAPSSDAPSSDAPSTDAPTTDAPRPGGSMTYIQTVDASFDVASMFFIGPSALGGPLIHDTLVRVDLATDEVIPRIAESLTSDDTATTWTITLREGVTFTDGTAYDADAVVFNWDRMKDPALAAPCKSKIDPLTYTATDARTITVELPAPQVAFPYTVWDCLSRVASPTAIQKFGAEYGSTPDKIVGAGAFTVTSLVPGTSFTLVKNPDFWDAPRPYLDELTVQGSADNTTTMDAILSGTVGGGFMTTFDANYERGVDAGLLEVLTLSAGGTGQFFNISKPPFDDVRVRKALQLATDLEDFNEKAADGQLTLLDAYYTEDSPYYDPEIRQSTNDLEAAQALIDEYVAEKGGPVTFELLGAETFNLINTVLQQQWSRLENVEISFTQLANTDWRARRATGDFQITAGISNCSDPECFYNLYYSTSTANVAKYSSPELDALIEEARAEPDVGRRKELFSQITRTIVIDEPAGVILYRLGSPVFFDPELVGGVEKYDASTADLTSLWLKE
ncbi:MAG: ABC transporter substrate-binding protein [Ilumatobacteraceae bacterium]